MAQERFSQTMSLPTYSANPVSSKAGLISNDLSSLASTIGFATDVAGQVMKSTAVSDIESEIKKGIEDYQKQSPTYIAQTNLDINNLQSKLQDPTLKDTEIPGIVKTINDKVGFLQNAKDQRKISEYEFGSRISQITREAIAKNPAFTKEILQKAQQTLDLNNIQQTIKMDASIYESARRSQEEERRNLRELGEKFFIMPPKVKDENGQEYLDYAALDRDVRKAMEDERVSKNAENLAKTQKNVSEAQLQEIVNNGIHWSVVNNTYRSSLSQFNTLMKDPTMPRSEEHTSELQSH